MHENLTLTLLVLQLIVFIYFIVVNGSYTFFTFVSIRDIRTYLNTISNQELNTILSGIFYKPLSIIVPAYNEQKTIVSSVMSLLKLNYPEYEVIVVNDASTDETLARLIETFRLIRIERPISLVLRHEPIEGVYISLDYPNLTVLTKKNGGKADALNAGINISRFPIFCCVDADSMLESDALLRASKLFVEDKEVIATGGIVRVMNGCTVESGAVTEMKVPRKLIECFQAVEYTRGFLSGRTSWNFFDSLLIISGAFGIFRKDMVLAVNGYRKTVGEDMDLVVRLHRHCLDKKIRYKVVFIPDPVCWTQVPSDMVSLLRQRNRWHRGLVDSLWHNRGMLFNPRYGKVGLFGFPYFFVIEALGPAIEFLGYCAFVMFFIISAINKDFLILFLFLAFFWGIWINLGSIFLDNLIYKRYRRVGDILKLCLFGVLEFIGYRQMVVVERFIATLFFWRKEWAKPKRQEISYAPVKKTA